MMKGKRNRGQESLKGKFTKLLDVPPEVVSDFPQIVMSGNQEIRVENFGGLLEYTSQIMRLNTKCGILVINGVNLEAQKMTSDYITIKGTIIQVGFVV